MLDTTKAKTKLTPSTVKNLRSISAPSSYLTKIRTTRNPFDLFHWEIKAIHDPNAIAGAYGMASAAVLRLRIKETPTAMSATKPPIAAVHNFVLMIRQQPR